MTKKDKKTFNLYKKEQLLRFDNAIAYLINEHGYIERKTVRTPTNNVGLQNLMDGYRNINSIGYEVDKKGNPVAESCGKLLQVHGSYPEDFVIEILKRFCVALHITETHLGDLVYVLLEPSDTEWRKMQIDEFIKHSNEN